jgi:mannose-1-phosphate guanylyltransferase
LVEPDVDGNRGQGVRVAIATRDTFVHAEDRVVATVGVENLVIVETPDAVLVAHRDHLQRVREVVVELKARGHDAYKLHRTVARPWGAFTVLQEGPGFKIKRIEVKPGGILSLQMHAHRSEHWVVVSGEARVTNGDRVYPIQVNESTFIPLKTKHPGKCGWNPGDDRGAELRREDDIVPLTTMGCKKPESRSRTSTAERNLRHRAWHRRFCRP